jgi:D-arabinose 1-dehydrogenase-like Zn-dependent alcohol dehydrogenase
MPPYPVVVSRPVLYPMIEKFPLSRVAEAYERMHSGKVRFRVVLTIGS